MGGIALLLAASAARGDLIPSGFGVTEIALSTAQEGAVPEPPAGVSTNSIGDVAFVAPTGAGHALFLRDPTGIVVKIVAVGDALAGGTISRLVAMPNSLDAYRQVVFYAALADGRTGIFRASPPPGPLLVDPTWGYRDRPLTFHLTGDGFTPGVRVRFGSIDAGFITVLSRSELTGVIPAGAAAGIVDITTSRAGVGERTLARAFEFRNPPVSGCRGFWPDHRPPDMTLSSLLSTWLPASTVLAGLVVRRRLGRRSVRVRRRHG